MDNSHLILLDYYQKYQGGANNLVGGLSWYEYLWPGNWFSSKNSNRSNDSENIVQVIKENPLGHLLKPKFVQKPNSLPSLVKLNVKLYKPSSRGGYAKEITPIINDEYNLGKHNFKNNDIFSNIKIDFTIIKSMNKILYGAGTFTAVYKVKDNNLSINDPNVKDNIYILRLTTQDKDMHMYDNPKIHKEYNLFNKYLPRIYYYGNFITSNKTYFYTITKLYNDFPVINNELIIPKILSNTDKFVFLYNNIVMLNDLIKQNYTHFDYKIDNVGFEMENNQINVILIDYDSATLQELNRYNKNFKIDYNNNVTNVYNTAMTYIPAWLSRNENPGRVVFDYPAPVVKFDKFAVAGLLNIIQTLNIKFKVKKLELYNFTSYNILYENYLFDEYIILDDISNPNYDELHLSANNYNVIPTYKLLLEIFSLIIKNKKKYLY